MASLGHKRSIFLHLTLFNLFSISTAAPLREVVDFFLAPPEAALRNYIYPAETKRFLSDATAASSHLAKRYTYDDGDEQNLSAGAAIGIAIGGFIAFLGICLLITACIRSTTRPSPSVYYPQTGAYQQTSMYAASGAGVPGYQAGWYGAGAVGGVSQAQRHQDYSSFGGHAGDSGHHSGDGGGGYFGGGGYGGGEDGGAGGKGGGGAGASGGG